MVSQFFGKDTNEKKEVSSIVFGKIEANEGEKDSSLDFKKLPEKNEK